MALNDFHGPVLLLDAAGATGPGANVLPCHGLAAIGVQLIGTFVGTVTFQGTIDGTNWVTLQAKPSDSSTLATTATAPGIWICGTIGMAQFRVNVTAYTGGSITAKVIGDVQPIGSI